MPKIPKTIRMLAKFGAKAMESSLDKGYYRAAIVKPRAAAHLKKRAIIDGSYGSFDPKKGGWNPEWDKHKNMFFLRPFKKHLRDRNREERAAKITKALETTVPQRIDKYRQEVEDRRPVKDIVYRFKRAALLEKGKKERRKPVSPAKLRILGKKKKERSKRFNMDSDFTQMDELQDRHDDDEILG